MSVKFHFLNVGDGDTTIVDFPSRITLGTNQEKNPRVMMIDIHHHDDHNDYEHVIDYYKQNFTDAFGRVKPIFRFILTHPHKDHLKGIKQLLEDYEIDVTNFWDIEHNFEPIKAGLDWDSYKEDWEKYSELRNGSGIKVLQYTDKNTNTQYWNEDKITILSPSQELYQAAHYKLDGSKKLDFDVDLNNMPYVLLVEVNNIKVLLASDAESRCWDYIVKNHADKIKNINILKAAHHGRQNGFHEEAVKLMNPDYIVFSGSEECFEQHGAEREYGRVVPNAMICRTCQLGNLVFECTFDGHINIL